MRLTGNEKWVQAANAGDQLYGRMWGDKDTWWPVYDIELDCGLIRIDVVGKLQVVDLADFAELKTEGGEVFDQDNFYDA